MRNVRAAFARIADRDERLGVRPGRLGRSVYTGKNPHLQGIQRVPNTNIVYISGSDRRAQLLVAQLGSRPRRGRLRSNRIGRDQPPSSDTIVRTRVLSRTMAHAGGFQIAGTVLAIGLEANGRSEVQLWDVSDPIRPRGPVSRIQRPDGPAGAVALVRDGRSWLLIVGRADSNILDFYRGTPSSTFSRFAIWRERELTGLDREFGNYQNLNLIRQDDGALYLVGLHRSSIAGFGDDYADLFRVGFRSSGHPTIRKVAARHLTAHGTVDFDAGAGVYVDGEDLIVYGVGNRQRGGRVDISEFRSVPTRLPRPLRTLRGAWVELYDDHDFRDRRVLIDHVDRRLRDYGNFGSFGDIGGFHDKTSSVRWLLPRGLQYLLFEHSDFKGRLLRLDGTGQPRSHRDLARLGLGDRASSGRFARTVITNGRDGWIELYDDDNFRDRRLSVRGVGRGTAIRNYARIKVEGQRGFGDKVSSVRWQLPRGATYRIYEHDNYRGRSLALAGTGRIREIRDLGDRGFGDKASSSRYTRRP